MRKQIFWTIGIKTKAYWIPHSIIFGLLRNQSFSHQFKKFYWGIPLSNHLLRLQPDSWKGLLIYQDRTYMHFVNNLSLIFQRLCDGEVLWRKAMWKSRVKWSCSDEVVKWGVEVYNLPQPSSFTTMVMPKGTSLWKILQKILLETTALDNVFGIPFIYFQLKTVRLQLMLNMFGDTLSREWW